MGTIFLFYSSVAATVVVWQMGYPPKCSYPEQIVSSAGIYDFGLHEMDMTDLNLLGNGDGGSIISP